MPLHLIGHQIPFWPSTPPPFIIMQHDGSFGNLKGYKQKEYQSALISHAMNTIPNVKKKKRKRLSIDQLHLKWSHLLFRYIMHHECPYHISNELMLWSISTHGVHCNNIRKQRAGKYRVIYMHKRENL